MDKKRVLVFLWGIAVLLGVLCLIQYWEYQKYRYDISYLFKTKDKNHKINYYGITTTAGSYRVNKTGGFQGYKYKIQNAFILKKGHKNGEEDNILQLKKAKVRDDSNKEIKINEKLRNILKVVEKQESEPIEDVLIFENKGDYYVGTIGKGVLLTFYKVNKTGKSLSYKTNLVNESLEGVRFLKRNDLR